MRFHRQMADFLYQRGFDKTGDLLAKSINIEDLTNSGLFRKIMELELSLADRQTSKCLAWCLHNRSKLQKIKSKFEIELRIQDFIELIKNEKRNEAVEYAQKFITPLAPPDIEIGQV